MNTERVRALDLLRAARKALEKQLDKIPETNPNHLRVQNLIDAVEDVEDELFIKDLTKRVKKLKDASKRLNDLNGKLKKNTKDLQSAADKVKKAAKAIGIVADIISKAAGLV